LQLKKHCKYFSQFNNLKIKSKLQILVAKNNKIICQNEFGCSDGSTAKALNRNSIFNIGFIGKEFNGVAIMI